MKTSDFIFKGRNYKLDNGRVTWKSPSNIALIKYWGKTEPQIPRNPSLSFTLDASFTRTTLIFNPKNTLSSYDFSVFLDGIKKDDFKPKIQTFFERIDQYVPFIRDYSLVIETHNSFPHSSGIASSASGMSALALCIMSLEKSLHPEITNDYFYKKASFLARLGSGSAARSIKGNVVVWGQHNDIPNSSNLFGITLPFKINPIFKNFHDTILLVDKGEKQVSSTKGHQLMQGHPFAKKRFQQADENLSKLIQVLQNGEIKEFLNIVESEALTLHAMMLTSNPYFILMQPNTLSIIQEIWKYRARTNANICFTLDAGANVHILYPEAEKKEINTFIVKNLVPYCQNNQYICDRIGNGSQEF